MYIYIKYWTIFSNTLQMIKNILVTNDLNDIIKLISFYFFFTTQQLRDQGL